MSMPALSQHSLSVPRSGIRDVFDRVEHVPDAISLCVGEPSATAAPHIVEAACRSIREGHTTYTNVLGIEPFREAVAAYSEKVKGLRYDEVYHPFVFDGSASIAPAIAAVDGMHERTVVVESLSKTFAMTGWRIGYLLGPEPLIEQTSKLAELMHSSVNSTAQYAAVAALTGPQEHVTAMREEYCAKRQIVLDELDGCTALRLIEPQGAFYAFVDVRACGMDCDRFSRMLLDEEHVAVVPGTAFGSEGAGFVRLSYAGDGRELREGVRRMRVFAERHVDPALGRHTPGYHHLQIMA